MSRHVGLEPESQQVPRDALASQDEDLAASLSFDDLVVDHSLPRVLARPSPAGDGQRPGAGDDLLTELQCEV
jgi:hypothetical protein